MLSYVPWTSVRTRPRSRKQCHACLLQIALCGFFVPSWILQTMPTCHAVMMKYICPRETIQSDCPDDWSWSSIVPLHAIKSQQNHIYQDCYGTYTLYIVNNLRTTVGQRFRAELVLHRLRSFFFYPGPDACYTEVFVSLPEIQELGSSAVTSDSERSAGQSPQSIR